MPYIDGDGYIVGGDLTPGTSTITRTGDSADTTPLLILGYQTRLEGRNVITDLLDGSIAVTLIPPRPRSGTLELLYADEFTADAAVELHKAADTFTLATSDRPSINMDYIVTGIGPALEDQTRELWVVSVDYQEVVL